MHLLINIAARFLSKRKFHATKGVSASLATGCNRIGCGHYFQVFCCILVSIMFGFANAASPVTFAELKVSANCAAHRTCLTRRIPAVSLDDMRTSEWRFVVELPSYFRHCGVCDRFCQAVIRQHSFDIQALGSNPSEIPDHSGRQFMSYISTGISDAFVKFGKFRLGLLPVLSSFSSSGQFLVEHTESDFELAQNAGSFDPCAIRENDKIDNPEIHPYYCLGFAAMRIDPGFIEFNLNRNVPMTCLLCESCRYYPARKSEWFSHSHPTKFGGFQAFAIMFDFTASNSKTFAASSLFLEARIAGFFASLYSSEKIPKCSTKIRESCIGNAPRQFQHPGKLSSFDSVQIGVESLPGRFLASIVKHFPAIQTPVVSEPCSSRTSFQPRPLDIVRTEPDALAKDHGFVCSMSNRTAVRTIPATEVSRRRASSRNHASMCLENCISWRINFSRFRGGAMNRNIAYWMYHVKG